MAKAIGIDLGTTNSVAAIKKADVRVLQNKENEDLTPSVVGVYGRDKKEIVVGSRALDRIAASPADTIISIKRLMGRGFRDKDVQEVRKKYPYKVTAPADATDDDVRVVLDGKEYSPVEISSMILKKIKEDAAMRENDSVDYAVITVPAYFTDKQITATRKAGLMAGLKVQRILDEPTAAAIAFGVDNVGPEDCKTILVYDLGGGTFDVSVLTIVGGVFAQSAICGDMWLGGNDFDHMLMDHVVEHVKSIYDVDGSKNPHFMAKLMQEAEKAKKTLSSLNRADIQIVGMLKDSDNNLIDVDMEITREQFERMIAGRVKESMELVEMALKKAQLIDTEIDHVLLVGGSSCIPLVRRKLVARFGEKKILMNVDPMKCVAYGAALLSARLDVKFQECSKGHRNEATAEVCTECQERLSQGIELARVTGQNYGIQTQGDKFDVIIPQGSPFPTWEPVVKRFFTPLPNLRRIKVPVYAGFEEVASRNNLQITAWLELPEHLAADTPVDVAFSLDDNGCFEKVKVTLKDGSGREIEAYADRGSDRRDRLERKLEQVQRKFEEKRSALDLEDRRQVEDAYSDAIRAANANDIEGAEKKIEEMKKLLPSEGWVEKAKGLLSYSDFVIEAYGWLLDPQQTYRIKKLMEELSEAIAKDDATKGLEKFSELDTETDTLPAVVKDLLILVQAAGRARGIKMLAEADQIQTGLRDIEKAIRAGDVEKAKDVFTSLDPVLKRIFTTSETGSGKVLEDVLKSAGA